jgi:hypothetical protein
MNYMKESGIRWIVLKSITYNLDRVSFSFLNSNHISVFTNTFKIKKTVVGSGEQKIVQET